MRVLIDCGQIHSRKELHDLLKNALSFPDYYGMNLDALSDCLSEISEKTHISFTGYQSMDEELQGYLFNTARVILFACLNNHNLSLSFGTENDTL